MAKPLIQVACLIERRWTWINENATGPGAQQPKFLIVAFINPGDEMPPL